MTAFRLTQHAAIRLAQRGMRNDDIELVTLIGTEVDDGYFIREKDFQALDRDLRLLRDRASKLVGKRLVIQGDTVVTGYHAHGPKERQLLRRAEKRASRR